MSEMRDRLIEKLLEVYKDDKLPLVFYFTEEEAEFIADKLIESGVFLPPCKIGDTVYQTDTDGIRIYKSVIKNIIFDTENIAFDARAIGKTVFLTEEEVRVKLKGAETK